MSIDLLRKAKKGQTTEREYWVLWRLLHDLVLVVLADFEVDSLEMEKMNNAETLEIALLDSELHDIQMELVRFYLYEWGFVCVMLYTETPRPSSEVLLLAVTWLVAFSNFFEKQRRDILERCIGANQLRLPPFPNDVDIDTTCIQKAAMDVVSTAIPRYNENLSLEGQMHQLHSAFGRLQGHLNELGAYTRYHERLLERLKKLQNKSEEHQDEQIPAYVLDLLAGPAAKLAKQVQVLAQSVQMIHDEAQFYKWINGLVLSLNNNSDSASQVKPITLTDNVLNVTLRTQIQEVQTLFKTHAEAFQQIEQGYKQEWKKWTSRQKSRSKVQQMETKVERFTHDVQTRELIDPQKLFLQSQRSWEGINTSHLKTGEKHIHLAKKEEVDRLQTQIASVIGEITREYCKLELR